MLDAVDGRRRHPGRGGRVGARRRDQRRSDMYFFPDAGLRAAADGGSAAADRSGDARRRGDPTALGPDALDRLSREPWLRAPVAAPGWRPVLGPHSIYRSVPSGSGCGRRARATHDAVVHLHAAETAAEVPACVDAHRIAARSELLDDLGAARAEHRAGPRRAPDRRTRSTASPRPAPRSPTARHRTSSWPPASPACRSCSLRA